MCALCCSACFAHFCCSAHYSCSAHLAALLLCLLYPFYPFCCFVNSAQTTALLALPHLPTLPPLPTLLLCLPAPPLCLSFFFFFNCMFYQLLRVQHSCSSTQSWGSVLLPSIVIIHYPGMSPVNSATLLAPPDLPLYQLCPLCYSACLACAAHLLLSHPCTYDVLLTCSALIDPLYRTQVTRAFVSPLARGQSW